MFDQADHGVTAPPTNNQKPPTNNQSDSPPPPPPLPPTPLLASILRPFLLLPRERRSRLLPRGLKLPIQPLQPSLQPLHLVCQRNNHVRQRIAHLVRIGNQHPLARLVNNVRRHAHHGRVRRHVPHHHPPRPH